MKLAPLLAQYLYSHKRLDLPGIGTFTFDAAISPDTDKNSKIAPTEGISFQNNISVKEPADLVAYISEQSGKMKALAAADLASYLELIQQFLNIGKPFLLEGIGSLVKVKTGLYEFTSGGLQTDRLKDLTVREATVTSATEESFSSYERQKAGKVSTNGLKKPVMALLMIAGIGIAVLGGYMVYKRKATRNVTAASSITENEMVTLTTAATLIANRSVDTVYKASIANPAPGYKFVLETAAKKRALERFSTLKRYNWNVQMETNDSLRYKLFLVLNPADTTRVLDSLTVLNGRKVYIEKFN